MTENINKTENRVLMRKLCELAGSHAAAAELIEKHTKVSCSVDTVKSWTCEATSSRARNPKPWAIDALEKQLKKLKKLD